MLLHVVTHVSATGVILAQSVLADSVDVNVFVRTNFPEFLKGEDGVWVAGYDYVLVKLLPVTRSL